MSTSNGLEKHAIRWQLCVRFKGSRTLKASLLRNGLEPLEIQKGWFEAGPFTVEGSRLKKLSFFIKRREGDDSLVIENRIVPRKAPRIDISCLETLVGPLEVTCEIMTSAHYSKEKFKPIVKLPVSLISKADGGSTDDSLVDVVGEIEMTGTELTFLEKKIPMQKALIFLKSKCVVIQTLGILSAMIGNSIERSVDEYMAGYESVLLRDETA